MKLPPRLPNERVSYSAIVDRPALKLPGDGRIAVWTIVNVEEWSIERAMPRTVLPPPYGSPILPDLPNWAWHEYGMRSCPTCRTGPGMNMGCGSGFGVFWMS